MTQFTVDIDKSLDAGISDDFFYDKVMKGELMAFGRTLMRINEKNFNYYQLYGAKFNVFTISKDAVVLRCLDVPVKMYYPREFIVEISTSGSRCKQCGDREYRMGREAICFKESCEKSILNFNSANIFKLGECLLTLADIQNEYDMAYCAKCKSCRVCARTKKPCAKHVTCLHGKKSETTTSAFLL